MAGDTRAFVLEYIYIHVRLVTILYVHNYFNIHLGNENV